MIFKPDVRHLAISDELELVRAVVTRPACAETRYEYRGGGFDAANIPRSSLGVHDKSSGVGHEILSCEVRHQGADAIHHPVVRLGCVVPDVRLHGRKVKRCVLGYNRLTLLV